MSFPYTCLWIRTAVLWVGVLQQDAVPFSLLRLICSNMIVPPASSPTVCFAGVQRMKGSHVNRIDKSTTFQRRIRLSWTLPKAPSINNAPVASSGSKGIKAVIIWLAGATISFVISAVGTFSFVIVHKVTIVTTVTIDVFHHLIPTFYLFFYDKKW